MNQEIIGAAFKNTLDSLDTFLKWFLSIAVVIWWAGLIETDTIDVLELKIPKSNAFPVIGIIFVLFNVVFLLKLKRLHFLLQETNVEKREDIVCTLFTHEWVLNPFGMFHDRRSVSWLHNCHRSLIVIVWWLCNASLINLYYSFQASQIQLIICYAGILGAFLLIGLMSLSEIISIADTLYQFSGDVNSRRIKERLKSLHDIIKPVMIIGVIAGLIITLLMLKTTLKL
ncbi:hypothetical protein FBD94_16815 [Pedobacter hiemivivus]|uniref:Uncharacterized protein n=1 Tax=Pedobacter hiemivivus TaxID=2530454 RepID=A0A4U1G952_9SPHI|nr:hypothetical protein [Pedobacter hiemivivus]TKC59193.1 hypothetical protein FBD94_16815 [Pedobacter hiemivivus]